MRGDVVADFDKGSFKIVCDAWSQRNGSITGENFLVTLLEEQADLRAFPFIWDFTLLNNGFQKCF